MDGVEKQYWYTPPPLNADSSIGTLIAGTHTIKMVVDYTNAVDESNEADNEYTKTITVFEAACVNLPVRRVGVSYNVLQDAYNDAVHGDTIQSHAVLFSESIDFSRNITVTVKGGYDCSFSTNVEKSIVKGVVTIRDGTVTFENIIIQ